MSETRSPLISVIIPHLNQQGFLRRCLESLAVQSFDMRRVEIIVVDNGSEKLPNSACSIIPDVQLLLEGTPGPGPARNMGISQSQAPILAFIDADCIAHPDWLMTIANTFGNDADRKIVGGNVKIALQDPNRMTMLEAYESIFAFRQKEYIEDHQFSGTGNLAMRPEVFQAVGPFAGINIAEDRDWGRRATALGFTIRYVPDMIVFHPARKSFSELCSKWDRHIAHDYAERGSGMIGKLRWAMKAMALVFSPVVELLRIARSDRVAGIFARWQAFVGLIRIRFYRAKRMFGEIGSRKKSARSEVWNRS